MHDKLTYSSRQPITEKEKKTSGNEAVYCATYVCPMNSNYFLHEEIFRCVMSLKWLVKIKCKLQAAKSSLCKGFTGFFKTQIRSFFLIHLFSSQFCQSSSFSSPSNAETLPPLNSKTLSSPYFQFLFPFPILSLSTILDFHDKSLISK